MNISKFFKWDILLFATFVTVKLMKKEASAIISRELFLAFFAGCFKTLSHILPYLLFILLASRRERRLPRQLPLPATMAISAGVIFLFSIQLSV
jgi:hypothetical protein